MTERDDRPARLDQPEFSWERSRRFWAAAVVAVLAILLVCAALITIAAARS